MKNTEDDIQGHLFARLISDDGKIEMGIHPVLFGYRVRAGYIGSMSYMFDWCGGDNQTQVELLYSIAKNVLEHRKSFDGVPICSKVKPFYNDQEFFKHIESLVVQPLEIIKLESLGFYRNKTNEFLNIM